MAKMMDIEQAENSIDTVIVNSPSKMQVFNEVEATADYGIVSTVRQLMLIRRRSLYFGTVPPNADPSFYLGNAADSLRDLLNIDGKQFDDSVILATELDLPSDDQRVIEADANRTRTREIRQLFEFAVQANKLTQE